MAVIETSDSPARAGRRILRVRRWAFLVLAGMAVVLVPWTLYLVFTLPAQHVAEHWDAAWVGFDVGLAAAAIGTALALLRRSSLLTMAATITGTLLVADAWFDCLTADGAPQIAWSVGLALVSELPLAALCFWVAHDADRLTLRTHEYLGARRRNRG